MRTRLRGSQASAFSSRAARAWPASTDARARQRHWRPWRNASSSCNHGRATKATLMTNGK
eukprot:6208035-Pleurochrysis_carterae.AAC.1